MDSKFIARYRRAIHEVEAGNASLELANKLERLGYKLTSSLERDFEESPGSETPYTLLKKALRECLQIEESARIKTRAYLDALAPDLHNAECDIVRAVYGTLEDVIGNLLLLLLTHWQEAELPEKYKFLIEWNRSKPMMELVKEFGRFTVPYELMRSRLNAAKSAAPQPAATMPATGQAETKQGARNEREKNEAKLHALSALEVRELLTELGMGSIYTQPGEWAAAFKGLWKAGVLKGNAYAATQWGIKEGYIEKRIQSTLKNAWSEDAEFKAASPKRIFKAVYDSALKSMANKQIKDNGK